MPKLKRIPLWQEISLALVLKGAVLTLVWFLWFSAPARDAQDGKALVDGLFSSQQPLDKEMHHGPVN